MAGQGRQRHGTGHSTARKIFRPRRRRIDAAGAIAIATSTATATATATATTEAAASAATRRRTKQTLSSSVRSSGSIAGIDCAVKLSNG